MQPGVAGGLARVSFAERYHSMTRRSVALLGLVLAVGCPALRAAPSSVVSALPADTVLVMQAPNLAGLVKKVKASPLGKIADLPDVSPLVAMMKQSVEMVRAQARAEAGLDPWKIITSVEGEVVLAYGSLQPLEKVLTDQLSGLQPQVTSEAISLLLSVDAGSSKATLKEALDKIFELGKKEGARVDTADFHGGKLTTIKPPEGAADKEFGGLYLAEQGSRFVLGLNRKLVEEVVASTASGKTGGLWNDASFSSTFKKAGEGSDLFFFVNVASLTKSLGNALNATFFGFFWQKIQSLLFGRSLNNLGVGAGIGETGVRQRVFVHNGGAEDGILGWLRAPAIDPQPPSSTPDNANMATSLSIDIGKIFDFFRELAQTAMSFQGGGDVNMLFKQQFGVALDDLRRAFGTRIDAFSTKVGDLQNPLGDLTMIIALKDAKPIRDLLKRMNEMAPGSLAPEQYQGHEVLTIPGGAPIVPGLCVTDSALIFSVEAEGVKKVLRRLKSNPSPLANDAGFKKAASASSSPGKVNLFEYQSAEYAKQSEQVYADLVEQLTMGLQAQGGGDLPPGIDKALLAGMKALTQAFGDTFAWGAWESDGFYMEGATPFK